MMTAATTIYTTIDGDDRQRDTNTAITTTDDGGHPPTTTTIIDNTNRQSTTTTTDDDNRHHMNVVHICTLALATYKYCTARHTAFCEARVRHSELNDQALTVVYRRHWFFRYNEPRNILCLHTPSTLCAFRNSAVLVESCR